MSINPILTKEYKSSKDSWDSQGVTDLESKNDAFKQSIGENSWEKTPQQKNVKLHSETCLFSLAINTTGLA